MGNPIKQVVNGLGTLAGDLTDRILISHRRKTEIKKMEDPRRVEIRESVTLTEKQKKEIDEYFMTYYGEKVPHTWHQYFTAYTGQFDVRYFPELLYIPEFEYFMNQHKDYQQVFADKNVTPMIAQSVGVRTPKSFLSVVAGAYRFTDGSIVSKNEAIRTLSNIGEAFIKPTIDSSSGQGCAVINIQNGIDSLTGDSLKSIIGRMGNNFAIQERVRCHTSISKVYPHSVNTFRILTYRWKDRIEHAPLTMRIGQRGGVLDNAHAGGMFIAVNDDGTLHRSAFTEFRKEFTEHPDTNIKYDGYQIPLTPLLIQAAKALHSAIPQIGVVNWDLSLDQDGKPILIEANTFGGGIWLFEMAHGKGPFGEKTDEILQWVRKQKRMKKSQRIVSNGFGI